MCYLRKTEGLSLCEKSDTTKAFQLMGLNKTSYEQLALAMRRALLRKPKIREDTYVSPDSLVASMTTCLERYGEAYTLAIKLVQTRSGPKRSNCGGYSIVNP